jgi:hypothetical protein
MEFEASIFPAPSLRERLSQLGVSHEHQYIDMLREMMPIGEHKAVSVDAMAEILIYLISKGIIKAPVPVEKAMGNFRPGTHICQLYSSAEDLASLYASYFKDGLKNNELCLCIVSESFTLDLAHKVFSQSIAQFDQYIKAGQFAIVSYRDFYLTPSGELKSAEELVRGCMDAEQGALLKGFDGLRGAGDTTWLKKEDWEQFMHYEDRINAAIAGSSMIGLCAYSLPQCGFEELTHASHRHPQVLVKRNDWCHKIERSEHEDSFLATLKNSS